MEALEVLEKVKLSTGVVIGVGQAQPFVIEAIRKQLEAKEPKPPIIFIESKGREEENPLDPDYLKAHEEWEADFTDGIFRGLIGLGTKVVEVPQGFEKPTQKQWVENLAAIGIEIPTNQMARYIKWIEYWATRGADDLTAIAQALRRHNGVPEEEVAEAAESFPDNS